jgi:hypothetical protein
MKRDILFKWTGAEQFIEDGYYIDSEKVPVPDGYWLANVNTGLPNGYYINGVLTELPGGIIIPTFAGYTTAALFSQAEWSNVGSYQPGSVLTPSVTAQTFDGLFDE